MKKDHASKIDQEEIIYERCAGIDVHKKMIMVCLRIGRKTQVKEFGTLTSELREMAAWLKENDVQMVAMESTGVYWHPVYDALESACDGKMKILVVNARNMKNVPGKKTDVKDAEWIASLLRAGLLEGSFIPPLDVRELRQMTRYRKNVVEDINTQKNRIEKSLQQAGFKLSTFLSDVFGVSGRNLIRVLIRKGVLTPKDIENEVRYISSVKKDEIKIAINGRLTERQRQFLKMQITLLDELLSHLADIEQSIEELSQPFTEEIARLDTIPGIAITSATAIIAEIGTDMSKFPTAEHFCSWAGVVPGDNMSAGKKKVPE